MAAARLKREREVESSSDDVDPPSSKAKNRPPTLVRHKSTGTRSKPISLDDDSDDNSGQNDTRTVNTNTANKDTTDDENNDDNSDETTSS